MQKRFQVRLNESDVENLSILYKHHKIPKKNQSDLFRKLLACEVERILHGSQDVKSSRTQEQVRLLEGWDCPCRFPIWRFHKPSKEWHRKVLCSNPSTQQILRTNELDAEVCKRCYDTGGSANLPALPEPKQEVSKPTPKPKPVTQSTRECEICGKDISKSPNHHTLCWPCYYGSVKGAKAQGEYDKNPPLSSPAGIRKREAARLRNLDERMKETKEEN